MSCRYSELIRTVSTDEVNADEIVADVIKKAGLEVRQ